MKILPGAPLLPQCSFLIQFLFKIDEHSLWSLPPLAVHNPYSKLMNNVPPSPMHISNSKNEVKALLSLPLPSAHIPDPLLTQEMMHRIPLVRC